MSSNEYLKMLSLMMGQRFFRDRVLGYVSKLIFLSSGWATVVNKLDIFQ